MATAQDVGGRIAMIVLLAPFARPQITVRVSVSSSGVQANGACSNPSISADGRVIAFESAATNLAPGDTNVRHDIYCRDVPTGTTELVSVNPWGGSGAEYSTNPALSADGRYVAFASYANDLVAGDSGPYSDVFLRDRTAGTTEKISVGLGGAISNNQTSTISTPAVSADGRFVAFWSTANNLVPGDTNGTEDIFVRDRLAGTTERASVSSTGAQANNRSGYFDDVGISGDGRFVVFRSRADNLVPGDVNFFDDVFLRDRAAAATTCVSLGAGGVGADGYSTDPSVSLDGRYVAFASSAQNLVASQGGTPVLDAFVHDRVTGVTELASVSLTGTEGNKSSYRPELSGDGRFATFGSDADDLVPGDVNGQSDVFLRDRLLGTTEIASLSMYGTIGGRPSYQPALSADGRWIVFASEMNDLVPGDTNGVGDIFVRDRAPCAPNPTSYCTAMTNSAGCVPRIVSRGTPAVSGTDSFLVGAEQVLPGQLGILFYGTTAASAISFHGGTLCISPPRRRCPGRLASSGGPPPCTGVYAYNFEARITSGIDPELAYGRQVWAQYWMRDPSSPSGIGLTDALSFVICW